MEGVPDCVLLTKPIAYDACAICLESIWRGVGLGESVCDD